MTPLVFFDARSSAIASRPFGETASIARLGYIVVKTGESERILMRSRRSSRPHRARATDRGINAAGVGGAGLARVEQFELRLVGGHGSPEPARLGSGTGAVAQMPLKFTFIHSARNECPTSAWNMRALGHQGKSRDRKTVLRASSGDPIWDRQGNQGP